MKTKIRSAFTLDEPVRSLRSLRSLRFAIDVSSFLVKFFCELTGARMVVALEHP